MSEAPEQIWTSPGMPGYTDEPAIGVYDVQYIRADHVDALVKQAREDALREAARICKQNRLAWKAADEILALIPTAEGEA